MLTIHVWPRWLKEFLLTHPLYKSSQKIDSLDLQFTARFEKPCGLANGRHAVTGKNFEPPFSGLGTPADFARPHAAGTTLQCAPSIPARTDRRQNAAPQADGI